MHYGSLVTAVASYIQAKSQNGIWRVRIENIDPPREQTGAIRSILDCLDEYGFVIDQKLILQNLRIHSHRKLAMRLLQQQHAYVCECSRKQLARQTNSSTTGIIYPGICRYKNLQYIQGKTIRLKTDNKQIEFYDAVYGAQQYNLQHESGDYVIYRGEDLPSYILAMTADDIHENYTEIVRGHDLLAITPKQIHLSKLLGYQTPAFMHIPIITDDQGSKLSKQTHAPALNKRHARTFLYQTLYDLGQKPPKSLRWRSLQSLWQWAIYNWDPQKIPQVSTLTYRL